MSNLFTWGLRKFYDIDVESLDDQRLSLQRDVASLNLKNK